MNEALPAQLARLELDRTSGYQELIDFYYGRQWAGRERRSWSVERRFKHKQLIVAETTTRALGSLLMPPDYAKVFGLKSVPFR